jgi:hypothetical protein
MASRSHACLRLLNPNEHGPGPPYTPLGIGASPGERRQDVFGIMAHDGSQPYRRFQLAARSRCAATASGFLHLTHAGCGPDR